MKKAGVIIAGVLVALLFLVGFSSEKKEYTEYLRIHIRANSNAEEDQAVKYKVKDEIVKVLTPVVSTCTNKEQAESAIENNLKRIEEVANAYLKSAGFNYTARARINNEEFPTRVYSEYTLYQGYYDALIVELGSGTGDNWWCVIYPPLCFTSSTQNYLYKSKIAEIIKDFFG